MCGGKPWKMANNRLVSPEPIPLSAPFYRGRMASSPFPTARRKGGRFFFRCGVIFCLVFHSSGWGGRWSPGGSTPGEMSCAGPQPLAAKCRGRLPCEGNKGTWIARATLASGECWQHGCRCLGKRAPEQGCGERLSSARGGGSPAGKWDQEVCAFAYPWNELDLESSSIVPLLTLCFVAARGVCVWGGEPIFLATFSWQRRGSRC